MFKKGYNLEAIIDLNMGDLMSKPARIVLRRKG